MFDEDLWYGDSGSEDAAESRAAHSITAQVGRIVGAKPFPIAAQKLSEITQNPSCKMSEVVRILESDPALSARVLRLVNSAGFALRTACTSVGHAAALVGISRLNHVATTAAILDMYDGSTESAGQILEHATVTGALSRYLGVHFGLPPEEMFTCGFLHDIGKLMLLDCEGDEYVELLGGGDADSDTVHLKERERYGYDHAILAGHVLAAWSIPEPVPRVVAWHHQATRSYDDPVVARMVSALRLADRLSRSVFKQFPEFEIERIARSESASYLEISEAQLTAMWPEFFTLAEKSRAGFRGEAPHLDPERFAQLSGGHTKGESGATVAHQSIRVPRAFPCVVCGQPSYANECPACEGYVCPEHQEGDDEWCSLCVDEYSSLQLRFPRWAYVTLGLCVTAMVVGSVIAAAGAITDRTSKLMLAPGLLSLAVAVLLGAWHRWLRRRWFRRTTPNRHSLAPPVLDGRLPGSLAPPPAAPSLTPRVVNPFEIGTAALEASIPPPASVSKAPRRPSGTPFESRRPRLGNARAVPSIPLAPQLPKITGLSSRPTNDATRAGARRPAEQRADDEQGTKTSGSAPTSSSTSAAPQELDPFEELERELSLAPPPDTDAPRIGSAESAKVGSPLAKEPPPAGMASSAAQATPSRSDPARQPVDASRPSSADTSETRDFRSPDAWQAVEETSGAADGW